jgi:hypothetical protein
VSGEVVALDPYRVDRQAKAPNPPRDLTSEWERLVPLAEATPSARAIIGRFAESKNITLEALEQLETRVKVDRNGGISLAFPRYVLAEDDRLLVVAIRYRPLDPDRARRSAPGSALAPPVLPQIVGDVDASEFYIVEGETDAARLWILTGGKAAIVVLGGTGGAFYPAWDRLYPGQATIYIALDNDKRGPHEPLSVVRGEEASEELLRRLGDRAVRLRPPGKDWCE